MATSSRPALQAAISAIFADTQTSAPQKAEKMAKAIDDYVSDVFSKASISTVTVPGTGLAAPSGGGPVTGTASGSVAPGGIQVS
jgi:hypothetical protein